MRNFRGSRFGRWAVVATAVAGAMLFAAPAHAYPIMNEPLAEVSGDLAPGGTVTLGGSGFEPGADVTIQVLSAPIVLGAVSADGAGAFSAQVTIPNNLSAGEHSLQAVGAAPNGGTLVLSRAFTVEGDGDGGDGDGDGTDGGTLPVTGEPAALIATVSGSALLVGVGVAVFGLRRRNRLASLAGRGDDR